MLKLSDQEIDLFRNYFRGMQSFVNYQWGGYSSKPIPVLDEVKKWLDLEGVLPPDPEIGSEVLEMINGFRRILAMHLNASEEEITLTDHTTVGLNIVGWGIDLGPGDRVLLSKHEHPANVLPWYNLSQRSGCSVDFVEAWLSDEQMIEQTADLLERNVYKIVAFSHVSRNTGYRLPVRELCRLSHQKGAFFLLDGAQSAGSLPIDVKDIGCDAYTLCGHKWFLAPQGTGALYVSRDSIRKVKPSWVGSKSQVSYDFTGHVQWKPDMKKHEFGTRPSALFAGWAKSLSLLNALSFERIFQTVEDSTQAFKAELKSRFGDILRTPMPWENSSAIFTIDLGPRSGKDFYQYAWKEKRILVSPLDDPHAIRVCNHFVNTIEERDMFLDILDGFLNERG